jgi:hypothetical protein
MFLPLYSPDYNPIEPAFSKIKAFVRRHGAVYRRATQSADERQEVYKFLHDAVYSITPEDAAGWFRHSGLL